LSVSVVDVAAGVVVMVAVGPLVRAVDTGEVDAVAVRGVRVDVGERDGVALLVEVGVRVDVGLGVRVRVTVGVGVAID
jgi:hypothetical protein